MFFKVRANRRVGKSKDPKNRAPEIAVPDLVGAECEANENPVPGGRTTERRCWLFDFRCQKAVKKLMTLEISTIENKAKQLRLNFHFTC